MRVSRSPQARVNAEIQLSFPIERTASIARPPARRAARLYSDARACVEGTADGWRAAAIMVSGGGSREAGRKRKAAASPEAAAMRREPRRGLGVAELERIRVALEAAERCYAAPPQLAPPPALAPPPPAALVVHGASLATVGNGALQLQLPRGCFTPYYVAAQHYESLTRLFASSGHPSPSLQNGRRQADQIQSAVTAPPATGQAASSESSSSAYHQQRQGRRRRTQQQPAETAVPAAQVPFVDLVDSDDDNGGEVEELDLELRL
ncbi:hypothetical protein PVAP13_9NG553900 [Panicum virgatum]|uniref:Uncharacterized protein n=1 Tax=Panicum virgatum TaxID=38727 RepID=A0A8T0MTT6_PANVG|nr:hypothetical protein PVAP13_9NG553900 [Panicum virgatum]